MDHRADIYSFGVFAYGLLTGAAALRGRAHLGTCSQRTVSETPEAINKRRASLPPALAALVITPAWRSGRPIGRRARAEVVRKLDDIATPKWGIAPTGTTWARAVAALARSRASRRWGALTAVVVLVLGIASWFLATRLAQQPACAASPCSRLTSAQTQRTRFSLTDCRAI